MDAIDRFGEALVQAGRRRRGRWALRWAVPSMHGLYAPRRAGSRARLRVVLLALALALAMTAVGLAATGVILTGAPVQPALRPIATAGEGIPVRGASRLLPLRAADPAGGLPWGMRIVHTTRGLVCVQIGRVYHDQLGELGVDGAFGDDGRFHPRLPDTLPDVLSSLQGWTSGNCAAPNETYSGDIVGLLLSAASDPHAGIGPIADRREISFGLLGKHAVSITYRSGTETHTEPVLPGLGAYLIVQRYTSGRHLGSVSETDGRDEPGDYSGPAAPNGALTKILYSYAGKPCIDVGSGPRLASCGLSETPPPRPAALPTVHEPLHVHLQIHRHTIRGAEISFRTPYSVTSASQDYFINAPTCEGLSGSGPDADVARGVRITLPARFFVLQPCPRSLKVEIEYVRFIRGLPESTSVGAVTIHEPPGTHLARAPRRLRHR
jgi:hypothetical protein